MVTVFIIYKIEQCFVCLFNFDTKKFKKCQFSEDFCYKNQIKYFVVSKLHQHENVIHYLKGFTIFFTNCFIETINIVYYLSVYII